MGRGVVGGGKRLVGMLGWPRAERRLRVLHSSNLHHYAIRDVASQMIG